jgi:hypothetical protein
VPNPLPDLGTGDFSCRCVFHEVVYGGSAVTPQPVIQILKRDTNIHPQSVVADRAARYVDVEER